LVGKIVFDMRKRKGIKTEVPDVSNVSFLLNLFDRTHANTMHSTTTSYKGNLSRVLDFFSSRFWAIRQSWASSWPLVDVCL
jgi:hypothetical protein